MEKTINTRILNKIDTQANWDILTDFVPKKGELIIYSPDENYDYSRIKIGDGITNVKELPFCNIGYDNNAMIGPITI